MTERHRLDTCCVDSLTKEINALEEKLRELYCDRAGRIAWTEDDSVREAWCCCCGRANVFPNDGEDTCLECVKNI